MRITEGPAVHEVEVKYQVTDTVGLLRALERVGVALSEPVTQDDQAYAPATWSYGMPKYGVPFARLRTQNGMDLFTVKQPQDNELACLEQETTVADRARMHEALLLMGFTPTVRIVKTRRTGWWGQVAVCVDEVEHLGSFIELERLIAADESGSGAQAELDALVRSLGVEVSRVTETYDSLIRAAVG